MASASKPPAGRRPQPCTLIILGATGDLTRRKLIPSLAAMHRDGLLPRQFAIVGFARREKSDAEFRAGLLESVKEHGSADDPAAFEEMQERVFYHRSTFEDAGGYTRLRERLDGIDAEHGTQGNHLFYLATPPDAYSTILGHLEDAGLSREARGYSRAIVEKPFGHDLPTAHALNEQVAAAFDEDQVFRIDHYLGKETVQNILALRFANGIFEPLWNVHHVDHVQITVAESIGVSGRGAYFDEAGIIRDMIQNHLLQVLTLVAMEPPFEMTANAVRDEKVKVLRSVRSFRPGEAKGNTVRGRYTRGVVGGVEVPGYLEEDEVAGDSSTETFAAVRLRLENWRWSKTPFYLRAGKRLPRRATEVAIHFRRAPHHIFAGEQRNRNVLALRIQPDEGISLCFGSKVPGPAVNIRDVQMDFRYADTFHCGMADAYQRLLLDAMLGDSTLFARRDEVEEAWRIIDSIVADWEDVHPTDYPAGSWGPQEAEDLLRKGRHWRQP